MLRSATIACLALMAVSLFGPQQLTAAADTGVPPEMRESADIFAGFGLSSEFFPGLEQLATEDIYLAGLAKLYPGRIRQSAPKPEHRTERAEPTRATLPRGITYLRVRDLQSALPALREVSAQPALIVDLRYVSGDYPEALAFASLWSADAAAWVHARGDRAAEAEAAGEADAGPSAAAERTHPFVVLVNNRTAGALEAFLDALQERGLCLAVGTPTAGMTGEYRPLPGESGYWVISGEFLASDGASLLDGGFEPEVVVAVSAESDYQSYQSVARGVPVERTLQPDWRTSDVDGADAAEAADMPAMDIILQRAFEIIAALQILGKLPPS